MKRLLVHGGIHTAGLRLLEAADDVELLIHNQPLAAKKFRALLADVDGIIQRTSTPIGTAEFAAAKKLRFIVRLGLGVDHIDIRSAESAGVSVYITVGENITSVAELTLTMMLALVHRVGEADRHLKHNEWRKEELLGANLQGKRLGILGLGRVGGRVARMAAACGMEVRGYDPYLPQAPATVALEPDWRPLVTASDVVSLHLPLSSETRTMVNRGFLDLMQPHAVLINTARGDVVDEEALVAALDRGALAGAGIDVFVDEPRPLPRLAAHPKVIATPHIGAATLQSHRSIGVLAAKIALAELAAAHSIDGRACQ